MTKLEEAARAMRAVLLAAAPETRVDDPVKPFEIAAVLAVWQALLPPDAAMVEAGARAYYCAPGEEQWEAAHVFTAMIQTAMEGK